MISYDVLRALHDANTLADVRKIIESNTVHMVEKVGGEYWVTLGSHDKNIFIQISIEYQQTIVRAVFREFNGKNYDLYKSLINARVNRAGYRKLVNLFKQD